MGDQGAPDQNPSNVEDNMEIDDELQLAIMMSMQQVKYKVFFLKENLNKKRI